MDDRKNPSLTLHNFTSSYLHLQQAVSQPPSEAASPGGSSGGAEHQGNNASGRPTLHCMMNEMARTLARRRAHLDKAEVSQVSLGIQEVYGVKVVYGVKEVVQLVKEVVYGVKGVSL